MLGLMEEGRVILWVSPAVGGIQTQAATAVEIKEGGSDLPTAL